MNKYWPGGRLVSKFAMCAGMAMVGAQLSGCDRSEDTVPESRAEETLGDIKESAGQFVENSRSVMSSAVDSMKEVGERSEKTLEKAGETISERSGETISATRDLAVDIGEKGGEAARKLGEHAKNTYGVLAEKVDELLHIKDRRAIEDGDNQEVPQW